MRQRPVVDPAAGGVLRGGVDERAAAVAVATAGVAERVERAHEPGGGIGPGRVGGGVELSGPRLVDPVEVGQHEVVLGGEVLVEGGLGHLQLRDDPVDPDPADAVRVEEREGGRQDPLARGGDGGEVGMGSSYLVSRQTCLLA